MTTKEKSNIQELLVKLYLRLNGYLSTGFIVHSDANGRIKSEVDVLAVRFPYNSEAEREIAHDINMHVSKTHIDLLICEVKSRGQPPRFNDPVRSNIDTLNTIIKWFGALTSQEMEEHSEKIHHLFQVGNTGTEKPESIKINNFQIRPLIFKPENKIRRDNQPWFISGAMTFEYISNCMKPEIQRATCATRYDYTAWGDEFSAIVSFFKDENYKENSDMDMLYNHIYNNRELSKNI